MKQPQWFILVGVLAFSTLAKAQSVTHPREAPAVSPRAPKLEDFCERVQEGRLDYLDRTIRQGTSCVGLFLKCTMGNQHSPLAPEFWNFQDRCKEELNTCSKVTERQVYVDMNRCDNAAYAQALERFGRPDEFRVMRKKSGFTSELDKACVEEVSNNTAMADVSTHTSILFSSSFLQQLYQAVKTQRDRMYFLQNGRVMTYRQVMTLPDPLPAARLDEMQSIVNSELSRFGGTVNIRRWPKAYLDTAYFTYAGPLDQTKGFCIVSVNSEGPWAGGGPEFTPNNSNRRYTYVIPPETIRGQKYARTNVNVDPALNPEELQRMKKFSEFVNGVAKDIVGADEYRNSDLGTQGVEIHDTVIGQTHTRPGLTLVPASTQDYRSDFNFRRDWKTQAFPDSLEDKLITDLTCFGPYFGTSMSRQNQLRAFALRYQFVQMVDQYQAAASALRTEIDQYKQANGGKPIDLEALWATDRRGERIDQIIASESALAQFYLAELHQKLPYAPEVAHAKDLRDAMNTKEERHENANVKICSPTVF